MSPLSYPPRYALNMPTDCQALTVYQSQLLWIGTCDRHSDKIKVFVLCDESTHTWKEIMHNIPQVAHMIAEPPIVNFISAASEGKYLIIVVSMGYQGMAVLLFDGQEWKKSIAPPESAYYGETDIIIHNGILYLCTHVGFYKVYLETRSLARNQLSWKELSCIPKRSHSNLTLFNGHIVIVAVAQSSKEYIFHGHQYNVMIFAYQSTDDDWLELKKFEGHLCWSTPSIMGLPSGRLLILGITPESGSLQFNVLEVIAKGNLKHIRVWKHNYIILILCKGKVHVCKLYYR